MIGGPVCGGRHTHTQTAKVKTGKRKGKRNTWGNTSSKSVNKIRCNELMID